SAAGSVGGQVFLNGQIADIDLAAATQATGYNFTEQSLQAAAGGGLTITAALADDTAGPGGSDRDGLTSDAAVQGLVSRSSLSSFKAGLDGTAAANFTDVLHNLTSGGAFFLNAGLLAQLAGGTLADGAHTLHLQATDSEGHSGSADVAFTLKSTPPSQ